MASAIAHHDSSDDSADEAPVAVKRHMMHRKTFFWPNKDFMADSHERVSDSQMQNNMSYELPKFLKRNQTRTNHKNRAKNACKIDTELSPIAILLKRTYVVMSNMRNCDRIISHWQIVKCLFAEAIHLF